MRIFTTTIAALGLAACAGNTNPAPVTVNAMTVDRIAVDHALARHFGVDPLEDHPIIHVVSPDEVFSAGWHSGGMTGEGVVTLPVHAGPPGMAVIYVSNQITDPARLLTVVCHEYIHVYQQYRLGMWDVSQASLETHARQNHHACGGK